jgi:hypothetical protein
MLKRDTVSISGASKKNYWKLLSLELDGGLAGMTVQEINAGNFCPPDKVSGMANQFWVKANLPPPGQETT